MVSNTNLPVELSSFIGRASALAELEVLVKRDNARLVTLVGPSGIGKSRLAAEAGRNLTTLFADGIWFISLLDAFSPNQIMLRITDTLPFASYANSLTDSLSQLTEILADRSLLLILDNLEPVSDQSHWLLDLLGQCPQLQIWCTCQTPLNIQGEWVFTVSGLEYPQGNLGSQPIEAYEAVQLFNTRARQVKTDFSLRNEQEHVMRICQLVDGLPLAIELAAGWVRTLSPLSIAAEIQHNLNLLSTRNHNVAARHRSIEAVFNQAWTLLTGTERQFFRRLSVFRGGFNREAVQHITGLDLETLDSLVSKALVHVHGENRYAVHELLRRMAESRLEEDHTEQETVLKLCSIYYAKFLQQNTQHLNLTKAYIRLDDLAQEIWNIQRALDHLLHHERSTEVGDSLVALLHLYQQAGWLHEGLQDFAHIAERLRQTHNSFERNVALAHALIGLSWWQHSAGQHEAALASLDESQDLLVVSQAPALNSGLWLVCRAAALHGHGDYAKAALYLDQARRGFSVSSGSLGMWLAARQDAELADAQNDITTASANWTRALALYQQYGLLADQVFAQARLSIAQNNAGQDKEAQQNLLKALSLGQSHRVGYALPYLFLAAALLLEQAKAWTGSSQLATEALNHPASDYRVRSSAASCLSRLSRHQPSRSRLTKAPFPTTRYPLDTVTPEVMENVIEQIANLGQSHRSAPTLTPREQVILERLASGTSNRQIALKLGIAEGTVKRYTHHLFAKLGAQNRAEAVYLAIEWNLIEL